MYYYVQDANYNCRLPTTDSNGLGYYLTLNTLPKISLATLDCQIADPEIVEESEIRSTLKLHDAQT